MPTRDITFSPDGTEVFFGVNIGDFSYSTILHSKLENGLWSEPEVASFSNGPGYSFLEPFLSADGNKLFFVSTQKNEFEIDNNFQTDIWVTEKVNGEWNTPYKLDTLINSKSQEYYPSLAENGNLYFTRKIPNKGEFIFKSEFENGECQGPVKLPAAVNGCAARFNATIARDESFIIVPTLGLKDTYGSVDYYISFFDEGKEWSNLINMGNKMNSHASLEYSTSFSPDGKYIFFMSARTKPTMKEKLTFSYLKKMHNSPENGNSNIYWMESAFIDELKKRCYF